MLGERRDETGQVCASPQLGLSAPASPRPLSAPPSPHEWSQAGLAQHLSLDQRAREVPAMPSNNPFAPAPPTEVSQAAHRFPDVLNQDPDLRHHQQQPGLYPPQQQGYGLAPQQTGLGYGPSPSSPYGTPAPALSPSPQPGYTGYQPQSQSLQPQQTGYTNSAMYTSGGPGGYSQPQQPQPYFSDLDPYSSLGASSFAAPSSSATSHQQQQQGGGTLLAVPQTTSHPRDYVHENKAALMVWDEYAWKQLFSRSVGSVLRPGHRVSRRENSVRESPVAARDLGLIVSLKINWSGMTTSQTRRKPAPPGTLAPFRADPVFPHDSVQALREAWETRIAGLKAASNSGADPTNVLSLRRDAEDKVGESLSLHAPAPGISHRRR